MANAFLSHHINYDQDAGRPMGCCGGDSDAARPLVKDNDHDQIEDHVDNACGGEKDERSHGISYGAEHCCAVGVDHMRDHTGKIGLHIGDCL